MLSLRRRRAGGRLISSGSGTVLAGTREGMSFAWRDRQVRAVLVVVTCVGLVGFNFNTLVPLLASDTLTSDAAML